MKPNFARVILGLAIAVIVLAIIERAAPNYAGSYVAVVVVGMVLANQAGLQTFAAQVQGKLKGS